VKSLRSFARSFLLLSSLSSFALADEPSAAEKAQHRVEQGIIKPMKQQEGHHFSRSRPAPREFRARVTSTTETADKSGKTFLTFAVDVRFGSEWQENDIVGCAYTASGDLYVKRGTEYRPAAFLLGKNAAPVAGVCEAPAPNS
jgi:hypothetical protein